MYVGKNYNNFSFYAHMRVIVGLYDNNIIVLRWHNKHISPFSVSLNEFNVLAYHVSIIFTCCDGGMLNMVVGGDNEYMHDGRILSHVNYSNYYLLRQKKKTLPDRAFFFYLSDEATETVEDAPKT